jgi:23S rRNA (guanosine2251-2'-O)-methyltransferase
MEKDRKNKSQGGKPRRDRNDHRDSRPSRDYRGASSKYDHVDRAAQAKENASIETDDQESCGIVIGRNAVRELLHSERTIDKLLVQRGEREGSIVVLVAQALEKKIPVVEVDRAKLDAIAGFAPHQGIIAMAAEKEYVDVEDILAIARERGEDPIIAIADGITDPYNLGALIRCAEGLGAHGLILPKRRAVGLTPLVSKASAGAIEHLAVAKVANLAQTVQDLQ